MDMKQEPPALNALQRAITSRAVVGGLRVVSLIGAPGIIVAAIGEMVSYGVNPALGASKGGAKLERIPGALGAARFALGKSLTGVGLAVGFAAYADELADKAEDFRERHTDPDRIAAGAMSARSAGERARSSELANAALDGDYAKLNVLAKEQRGALGDDAAFIKVLDRVVASCIARDDASALAAVADLGVDAIGSHGEREKRVGLFGLCAAKKAQKCSAYLEERYRREVALLSKAGPAPLADVGGKLAARKAAAVDVDAEPKPASPGGPGA